jgi:hypothetical protein
MLLVGRRCALCRICICVFDKRDIIRRESNKIIVIYIAIRSLKSIHRLITTISSFFTNTKSPLNVAFNIGGLFTLIQSSGMKNGSIRRMTSLHERYRPKSGGLEIVVLFLNIQSCALSSTKAYPSALLIGPPQAKDSVIRLPEERGLLRLIA